MIFSSSTGRARFDLRFEMNRETRMQKFSRVMQGLLLVAALGHAMAACSTVEQAPAAPSELVAVTDFTSVAGQWEGLLVRSPPVRSRNDDWVKLHITEDGTFRFEAYRTIGAFTGAGQFTLDQGTLLAKSEKGGRIAARLYRHAGQSDRLLKVEGTSGDGITYYADLTPARRR